MRPQSWFLILSVVLVGYLLLRPAPPPYRPAVQQRAGGEVDYDTLAVSDGMSDQAQALNLQDDLDVSLLPDIGKQVIRDAAQQGLQEQAFLQYVLQEVSNRVREISTIDLNGDDVVDPVLVKPEPSKQEQYVLLSLQVPGPEAYPLPEARERDAWQEVETIEVATMTVTLNDQALTVQASGNQHVYPNAGQHYVARDTSASFLQMYLGMRMLEWMFLPPMFGFWGPGWSYGYYNPAPVGTVARTRAGTVDSRGYSRASARSSSAIRTSSGGAPRSAYSRQYSRQAPQSVRNLRSTRGFRRRQSGQVASGGFGRSRAGRQGTSAVQRRSTPTRRNLGFRGSRSAPSRRGLGSFQRRSLSRGFRSFGRGFGGFRFRR